MAYEKLNLADGDVLKAEHLAHMEQGIADAVSIDEQTLTDEQKTQARTNIGAIDSAYADEGFRAIGSGLGASQAGALKWDGLIGDRAYIEMGSNVYFVHVTDEVPTVLAEMPLATLSMTVVESGAMTYGQSGNITALGEDGLYTCGSELGAIIVPADNYTFENITFPKKGVYFCAVNCLAQGADVSLQYLSSLMVPGYSFAGGGGDYFEVVEQSVSLGETLTWDGNESGREVVDESFGSVTSHIVFCSEATPTADDLQGKTITITAETTQDGTTSNAVQELTVEDGTIVINDGIINFDNLVFVVLEDNAEAEGVIFPRKGTYFVFTIVSSTSSFVTSITIPGFDFTTVGTVDVLKPEHLPDTVVQNGDTEIILSSPGGTKFSITVGDDGTLTATEVTA